MKAIHFGILFIGLSFSACKKKDDPKPVVVDDTPTACFNVSPVYLKPLDVVNFSNCSKNYQRVEWNFGDGGSSTLSEPTYRYVLKGKYTVKLKTFNGVKSQEAAKEIIVAEVFGLKFEANYMSAPTQLKQGDFISAKLWWKKTTEQGFSQCGLWQGYYDPNKIIVSSDNVLNDFSVKYIFKINYEYYRGYKTPQSMMPDILLGKDSLVTPEIELSKHSSAQSYSAALGMLNTTYTISFTNN